MVYWFTVQSKETQQFIEHRLGYTCFYSATAIQL
mgnify:CR=1 FL=1